MSSGFWVLGSMSRKAAKFVKKKLFEFATLKIYLIQFLLTGVKRFFASLALSREGHFQGYFADFLKGGEGDKEAPGS